MLPALALLLVGCEGAPSARGGPAEVGFCYVARVIEASCLTCHGADGRSGGLDLETDPAAALRDVPSSLYAGRTLVVAGDPEESFLYVKVSARQGAGEGDPMPPFLGATAEEVAVIQAWIAQGASPHCGESAHDSASVR